MVSRVHVNRDIYLRTTVSRADYKPSSSVAYSKPTASIKYYKSEGFIKFSKSKGSSKDSKYAGYIKDDNAESSFFKDSLQTSCNTHKLMDTIIPKVYVKGDLYIRTEFQHE